MKKNYLYVLLAASLTAASCSNELPENAPASDGVIHIEANVSPQTRSPQLDSNGSGTFAKGDGLSIFVAGNGTTVTANYAYASDLLTWSQLGFPEDVKQVTFAACYPQPTTAKDGTFEFNTLTAPEKDLLLAPAQPVSVGTAETVRLTFGHALHNLNLNFVPGNGYTDSDIRSLTLVCQAKTTCVVDAAQGTILKVNEETGDYQATGNTASFYLAPQATDAISLTIGIQNESKKITLDNLLQQLGSQQTELQGGKRCSLTLKVGREGITIEGATIGAWGDQVTADGEIVIG
ncbi:fimbrillin family protein [uncultured Mediterranea sp.]|uniref:fimbrillin family protein n=1 Tax=uncultured Mediterranea sp. TaxID=1926662 RepID=UPI00258513CC|nr:fimbrillin family protein [uncultured Mediterranea sp.]